MNSMASFMTAAILVIGQQAKKMYFILLFSQMVPF